MTTGNETNQNIETFIKQQLKLIPPFEIIELPMDDNIIDNLDTAVNEIIKTCKQLISKDGKLRNIIKNIKNNKLNKTQTNLQLAEISKNIKLQIFKQTKITNNNVKFLINNRINQILKNIIYSLIDI